MFLFLFLAAVAVGTILGENWEINMAEKIIWISILGAAPFTLCLPYLSLFWTIIFAVLIGLIIASAFSAILVYATDLMPNRLGWLPDYSSVLCLEWAELVLRY
ncbi:hypothetical protein [Chryseobacterium indoltheticum]|uniref:hypothetical protein n=1 Tax=Chryseobacterium indoltheticum TaxID=254 RepID=UPI003F495ABC